MWWSYLFRTSLLCFSFSAWILLTFVGYFLLRYHRRNPVTLLAGILVASLWGISTFNFWYEGIVHLERISLLSSFNSWAFVVFTPLSYLYIRLRMTGCVPRRAEWSGHLLLPALLGTVYIGMTISSPVSDALLYSWVELLPQLGTWWGLFRLSCYVFFVGQLCVYILRILKNGWLSSPQIVHEIRFFIFFGFVSLLCVSTPFWFFHQLYLFFLVALAFHLLLGTPIFRLIKLKVNRLFGSTSVSRLLPKQEEVVQKKEIAVFEELVTPAVAFLLFTPQEEAKLEAVVRSSLCRQHLTVGMLAREMDTNKSYLSRYFKKQRNLTFSDYVSACRLEEAERLLLETNETVVEIAEQIGYQSLSHFYTVFAARYKMPPAQWRKLAQESSVQSQQGGNVVASHRTV